MDSLEGWWAQGLYAAQHRRTGRAGLVGLCLRSGPDAPLRAKVCLQMMVDCVARSMRIAFLTASLINYVAIDR